MPRLARKRTVYDYDRRDTHANRVWFSIDEDTENLGRTVLMSLQDWEDMGSPEHVTVSIRPGDLLDTKANDICQDGIRSLRKQRGLTIEQTAMLAGVDPSTISRAERGLQKLKPESVVKLSRALKVPTNRIVEPR